MIRSQASTTLPCLNKIENVRISLEGIGVDYSFSARRRPAPNRD